MLAHAGEMQLHGYERARRLLADSAKTPRELIVLGRHLNIVRANNSAMGSPANRIGIMADHAARAGAGGTAGGGAAGGEGRAGGGGGGWGWRWWDPALWLFRWRLGVISLAYNATQMRRSVWGRLSGTNADGFEDVLRRRFERDMEEKLGLKINMGDDETWESVAG